MHIYTKGCYGEKKYIMIHQWNLIATCVVLGPLVVFLKVNVHTSSFQAYSQPCTSHL